MNSLSLSLKVMVPFDFQEIASTFSSFSSPPRALMALSRTALGSLSSARTKTGCGRYKQDGEGRDEKPFHGDCLTDERKLPGVKNPCPDAGSCRCGRGGDDLQSYAVRGVGYRECRDRRGTRFMPR